MTHPLYTAVFLRVRRLLQVNQMPLQGYLDLIREQGLSDELNRLQAAQRAESEHSETARSTEGADANATPVKDEVVQTWLQQTEHWRRVRATHDGVRPISSDGVWVIAESCTWAELEDVSDLAAVQSGQMYPVTLELGWGDRITSYHHTHPEAAGIYFLAAYQSDEIAAIGITAPHPSD